MPPTPKHIGTFEAIVLGIADFFSPLQKELGAGRARRLLAEMGLLLPASVDGVPAFVDSLSKTANAAGKLPNLIQELTLGIDTKDNQKTFTDGKELASKVLEIIEGVEEVSTSIKNLGGPTGIPPATLQAFADQFPKRLVDYLLIRNLERMRILPEIMELFGVIERVVKNSGSSDPNLPEYTDYKFNVDKITGVFQSPLGQLGTLYDWGTNSFDGSKLLPVLQKLSTTIGIPSVLDTGVTPNVIDFVVAELSATTDTPKGILLSLSQKINIDRAIPFNQGGDWQIEVKTNTDIYPDTSLKIRPDGNFVFKPPTPSANGEYGFKFTAGKADSTPFIIFGQADASRLQVKQFILEAGTTLNFKPDGIADSAFKIGGKIKGGKLLIDTSKGDGFLNKILSGFQIENDFDLGMGFSSKDGLYFHGSAGLEIRLPAHIALGPVEIIALLISVRMDGANFPIGITSSIKAELGPLSVVAENFGITSTLSLPANRNGNLGPLNLDIGFKPPSGLGLSINAGAVIGGGYLFFDYDKEEYAGALELTIAGFISAKAIGLITTKMPDGSKGFSLLIIITAEFNPPFQLGYGFTLIGVGGLLGLNRTVLLDPLREGVRTGAVNNILFPQNVVANAPRIISDLKTIFPAYEGKFLIGPMGKLGWGTPTLISLSLGLIIEIPGNLAILGVLKIVLPEERVPLVKIQVAFVGTLDFNKKMLTFDTSLFESSVLIMTLEGDMAVRLKWGDNPDFLLSVGGFHPSYTPPPLSLPTMRRLAINILNTSVAKIRVECYMAVTSNTVQFGAKAELFFGFSAISVEGHIAFDALFQFSPFYFIIQISASVSLKVFGMGLFSIRLRFSLEGPTPWRAKGTGSISFLFFDVSADFDTTWGEAKNTAMPETEVLPRFLEEINKREQWSTALSTGKNLLVSLRRFTEDTAQPLVLHPAGSLVIQQKLLPLTVTIDRIGNKKTSDVQKIAISSVSSNGIHLHRKDVNEDFARSQYQKLTDAEKLSKPSFEKMPGGVEVSMGGNSIQNGKMVRRNIAYEVTLVDKKPKRPLLFTQLFGQIGILFTHFLKGNSASKSVLSKAHAEKRQPFAEKVEVRNEGYSVAFKTNNQAHTGAATFASEMMAQSYLHEEIGKNPNLKKELHIIPNYELQEP